MTYRNPSQHPTPAAQIIPMSLRSMEEYLEQSGFCFEGGVAGYLAEIAPAEELTYAASRPTQNFLFDGLNDAQEAEAARDLELEPMEAARLIVAEMAANAIQREIATPCEAVRIHCANALTAKVFPEGHADRASLIAACILDCPIKHFTTTEIAKYARLTLDTPLSEREIDSVLLALKAEKRLTTRGGFWVIGGAL